MVRGAKQHRLRLQRRSRLAIGERAGRHIARLIGFLRHSDERRRRAGGAIGPKVLDEALGRERDDRVGGGQNGAGRAVVAVERDHAGGRVEALRKIEDVAHRRGAEGIDRLRVVADDGQAPAPRPQRQHDLALESVGVLVFVDQQMIESGGDFGRDRWLRQHLREIEKQVVVVEHMLALLGLDIGAEQRAQGLLVRRGPGKPSTEGGRKLAACVDDPRVDRKARRLGGEPLVPVGKPRLVPRPVHQIRRILAVVNGELRIEAEARRILAQEPRADGVEGARIGRRRRRRGLRRKTARQQPLHPPAELRRRATRERRQHDALRIGAGEDQRRDPMREHRRLARPRPRDDEQRPGTRWIADPVLDRELLRRIELDDGRGANQGKRHGREATMFRTLFARPTRWTNWAMLAN